MRAIKVTGLFASRSCSCLRRVPRSRRTSRLRSWLAVRARADLRRHDPRRRPAGHRGVECQGRRLEQEDHAVVEDSQCTPDPAVNAANKVIDQDKVKYIVGEVCSKASIPVSEIANSKKVIQISPPPPTRM